MSIDANRKVAHIAAPQDREIAELNARLNRTYMAYGAEGQASATRQQRQDRHSAEISPALLARRAETKASSYYDNSSWDLVDALTGGALSEEAVAAMAPETLPAEVRDLEDSDKLEFLRRMAAEREAIRQRIAELAEARKAFVAERQREQAVAAPSIGDALSAAVRREAARKHFTLEP